MDTIIQTWKSIPGYEGYYEINMAGHIRRKSRAKILRKRLTENNILSTRINNWGYEEVRLSKEGKSSTKFVHKLLAQSFIENRHDKPEINHKNGIKTDNSLGNLEWVTHAENIKHAYENNLCKKALRAVIDMCANKEYNNAKQAAKQCGINYFTLRNYLNGSRTNPTCLQYKQAAQII